MTDENAAIDELLADYERLLIKVKRFDETLNGWMLHMPLALGVGKEVKTDNGLLEELHLLRTRFSRLSSDARNQAFQRAAFFLYEMQRRSPIEVRLVSTALNNISSRHVLLRRRDDRPAEASCFSKKF